MFNVLNGVRDIKIYMMLIKYFQKNRTLIKLEARVKYADRLKSLDDYCKKNKIREK